MIRARKHVHSRLSVVVVFSLATAVRAATATIVIVPAAVVPFAFVPFVPRSRFYVDLTAPP